MSSDVSYPVAGKRRIRESNEGGSGGDVGVVFDAMLGPDMTAPFGVRLTWSSVSVSHIVTVDI